jgi:hypothetical protein
LTANDACVAWQCNAPCTHPSDLYYAWWEALSFNEMLDVLMLAYESDNNDVCTNYSDDDYYWIGNAVLANGGRITDSREATWDEYNGGGTNPLYIFFNNSPHFDAKLRIAWRYLAGETILDPLQFGNLTPSQPIEYYGTNLPNPPGLNSGLDLGWKNNAGFDSPDVYFSFSLTQASEVNISTDFDYTDFDTEIYLYTGAGNPIMGDNGADYKAVLTTVLDPGTYIFRVEGFTTSTGKFRLTLNLRPKNNEPCNPIGLPADGTVQSGFTNVDATAASGESAIVPMEFNCVHSWCESPSNYISNSVWFNFIAPASGAVEVSTCGLTDFDTQLAVYRYSGTSCHNFNNFTLLAASDDVFGCGFASKMNVTGLTPGHFYYILVDGYAGGTGDFSIQVTPITATAAHEVVADSPLLKAYPNPTSGLLTIQLDDQLTMQACTLSDLRGKTVAELRWTQPVQQAELDLGALPAGVYFLQVRSGERMFSEKIVVQ